MPLIFLFIKIYPVFALSMSILCFDLARSFRRKGNAAWIGLILFMALFLFTTMLWIGFRGDQHADLWFQHYSNWLRHP